MAVRFQGGKAVPVSGEDARFDEILIDKHIAEAYTSVDLAVSRLNKAIALIPASRTAKRNGLTAMVRGMENNLAQLRSYLRK